MPDICPQPWQRHDLLLIAPEAWRAGLRRSPALAELPFVQGWAERGWPVILRRHTEDEDQHLVPVGLPLPPGAGRHRVALLLPRDGILHVRRPPSLRAAVWAADPAWQSAMAALLQLGRPREPLVVGSLLWQHITALPYLSLTSDLDLLWTVRKRRDIGPLLDGIARVQRDAPMRIDGEVILPDGTAVNWRELWVASQGRDETSVLGKSTAGVRLLDRNALSWSSADPC